MLPFSGKMDEDSVDAQLDEADVLYRQGNLEAAAGIYKSLLKSESGNAIAYYRLGNIAFRGKQLKRASFYFQKALELQPDNDRAHYNLAVTHLSMAERHFKFYTANLPASSDVSQMTQILSAIAKFSGEGQADSDTAGQSEIDKVLNQLSDGF